MVLDLKYGKPVGEVVKNSPTVFDMADVLGEYVPPKVLRILEAREFLKFRFCPLCGDNVRQVVVAKDLEGHKKILARICPVHGFMRSIITTDTFAREARGMRGLL